VIYFSPVLLQRLTLEVFAVAILEAGIEVFLDRQEASPWS
jgi:hypothetical protein